VLNFSYGLLSELGLILLIKTTSPAKYSFIHTMDYKFIIHKLLKYVTKHIRVLKFHFKFYNTTVMSIMNVALRYLLVYA